MLLDEDPAALIHECIQNFSTAPDRAALARISSSLAALSQHRAATLAAQRAHVKKQQRHMHSLTQSHDLSLAAHNPTEHAQSMIALDRQKFRLAKEASDLEIEGERLEGEVGTAEAQLREVEGGGGRRRSAVSREEGDGLQALKIKLYRSLGADFEGEGESRRVVVRNVREGNVEVVRPGVEEGVERFWRAVQ